MYSILLTLHNTTRWLVLITGVWTLVRLANGWLRHRAWTRTDRNSMRWFALILSVQFVFGAVLYVFPDGFVQSVLGGVPFAAIMQERVLRFFTLEHPVQMTVAIGVSHMANAWTRRMRNDQRRFRVGTLLLVLTLLLIITAIPWPGLDHGRPWLRLPF